MNDTTSPGTALRPVITRHELERRHAALADLRRYLESQEHEFSEQRRELKHFVQRYLADLGPLYKELSTLDAQLQHATHALIATLRLHGIDPLLPEANVAATLLLPPGAHLPQLQSLSMAQQARFEGLPPAEALPPVPVGAQIAQWAPPTLKILYRRAAMRLHPDRAGPGLGNTDRAQREQQMMQVNAAYAAGERWRLEAMLLASGEDPVKVTGGNAEALRNWLAHCEHLVQVRLRQVNDYLAALASHSMHKLWRSVAQSEAKGLDPMGTMALKLRQQIDERRKELYISQRLKPDSSLARAFLHRRLGGKTALGGAAAAIH